MRDTRVTIPCGQLTLEGVLRLPNGDGPFPTVVLCHPHPQHGGSMDNNVVTAMAAALDRQIIATLRFNFRGVGGSQGQFASGIGEQEDVKAALDFLASQGKVNPDALGLAGYSWGAGVAAAEAAKDSRVKALAAVSYPLTFGEGNLLADYDRPKLFLTGDKDEQFSPVAKFRSFVAALSEPKESAVIAGADHFWAGQEDKVSKRVADFFDETFFNLSDCCDD